MQIQSGVSYNFRQPGARGVTGTTSKQIQDEPSSSISSALPEVIQNPVLPGAGLGERFFRGTMFAGREVSDVVANDPALFVRGFATRMLPELMNHVDNGPLATTNSTIVSGVRTLVLGADIYRLQRTWKDPSASPWEKGLDVLRVATDSMGLVGSVLRLVAPQYAGLGNAMLGLSYTADLVSHSARAGMHGSSRIGAFRLAAEARALQETR